MSLKKHFAQMLAYDRWATERVLAAIEKNKLEASRELRMLVHVALAELLWVDRMRGIKPAFSPFDVEKHTMADCRRLAADAHAALEGLLEEFDEARFGAEFDYSDMKGNPYRDAYGQTLAHVFNHATHHRAQINLMLRERGIEPEPIDLVFMTRKSRA